MKKLVLSLMVVSSLAVASTAMALQTNCQRFNHLKVGDTITSTYNVPSIHKGTGASLKVMSVQGGVDTFVINSGYNMPGARGSHHYVHLDFHMRASCSEALNGGLTGTMTYGSITQHLDANHSRMTNMGNGQFVLTFQGSDLIPVTVVAQKF